MTGLDLEVDELVEIAVVITDYDLNPVDAGLSIVIKPDASALESMGEFVRAMHTESGLIEEIPNGVSVAEAEYQVLEYVLKHVPDRAEGAARGQLHRHRPRIPHEVHAAPRRAPALSQRRRLVDQGAREALVSRARTSTRPRRTAATAPSPTSSSRSANCTTTGAPCSSPSPGPTSQELQTLAAAVVDEFAPKV